METRLVLGDGAEYEFFTAEYADGSFAVGESCVPLGAMVDFQYLAGSYASEISGYIYDGSDTEIAFFEGSGFSSSSSKITFDGNEYYDEEVFLSTEATFATSGMDCDDSQDYTYPGAAYNESTTECLTDMDGDGWAANSVDDTAGR